MEVPGSTGCASGSRVATESEEMTSGSPPNLLSVGSVLEKEMVPTASSPGPDSADASPDHRLLIQHPYDHKHLGFPFPFRKVFPAAEEPVSRVFETLASDVFRWVLPGKQA